ncbi:btk-binding protein-related [Anaeramoeba flamelloides]|uniref:Btk-binding protein-related n=1 Tax=Anaeramoeba flamelloides TaxID=1746091 RepID=A0ABQ8XCK0_9EUKA|nr:btk-binding protein-related [Anaeramoeba flamelloides]
MKKFEEDEKYQCFSYDKLQFRLSKQKVQKNTLYKIDSSPNIAFVCGGFSRVLILTKDQKLYTKSMYACLKKYPVISEQKLENIVKITHGYDNGLILTRSGLLYSIGTDKSYDLLPFESVKSLQKKTAYLSDYFVKKKIRIRDIECCSFTNYYVSTENVLYGSGYNEYLQLGVNKNENSPYPTVIAKNVLNVYSSQSSSHAFYSTVDNKLYGFGKNKSGELGVGGSCRGSKPRFVPNVEANMIKKVVCSYKSTAILLKNGKVLTAGESLRNGTKENHLFFVPIPLFEDNTVYSIGGSFSLTLAITAENQVYVWGQESRGLPKYIGSSAIVKVDSSILPKNKKFLISSSWSAFFLCPQHLSPSRNNGNDVDYTDSDFLILLERGQFNDHTLTSKDYKKIKILKLFVKCRINRDIEQIEKILKQYYANEIKIFLKWVYSGQIENFSLIQEICEKLELVNFSQKSLLDDIKSLYENEDSKNFNLLVNKDGGGGGEKSKEEEQDYEEIPVHKFILYARSGLFREMFDQIDIKSNSVTDYSGKTFESLEILIKYFYTKTIELTADDDPGFLVEELNDAIEYYQLNPNSNLSYCLENIKKKYDIKEN